MKSLKQIADELGVSKQQVYRVVKRLGITASNEAVEAHQMKQYDADAEALIKAEFSRKNQNSGASTASEKVHHEVLQNDAVLEILRTELEAKNKQIEALQVQVSELTAALNVAQALHAGMLQQQQLQATTKESDVPVINIKKAPWWAFWRR